MDGIEIYNIPPFQNVSPSQQDTAPDRQAPIWSMDFGADELEAWKALSMSRLTFKSTAVYVFTGLALHEIALPADGSTDFSNSEICKFAECFKVTAALGDYRGILSETTETECAIRTITFGSSSSHGWACEWTSSVK